MRGVPKWNVGHRCPTFHSGTRILYIPWLGPPYAVRPWKPCKLIFLEFGEQNLPLHAVLLTSGLYYSKVVWFQARTKGIYLDDIRVLQVRSTIQSNVGIRSHSL